MAAARSAQRDCRAMFIPAWAAEPGGLLCSDGPKSWILPIIPLGGTSGEPLVPSPAQSSTKIGAGWYPRGNGAERRV